VAVICAVTLNAVETVRCVSITTVASERALAARTSGFR
jgi:hypothetical protein